MNILIKRIYDTPEQTDGSRVLVDRLWPRGIAKATAPWDEWIKAAAPSLELRRWFDHDPKKWNRFRKKYAEELDQKPDVTAHLLALARQHGLTLLYAARDTEHNEAEALREYLLQQAVQP